MKNMNDEETGIAGISCNPFPGSKKVYLEGSSAEIRVPMREVALSVLEDSPGDRSIYLYDTSGPFTDPNLEIDINQGIPPLRKSWIEQTGRYPPDEGFLFRFCPLRAIFQ